jgi:hypothetical protein
MGEQDFMEAKKVIQMSRNLLQIVGVTQKDFTSKSKSMNFTFSIFHWMPSPKIAPTKSSLKHYDDNLSSLEYFPFSVDASYSFSEEVVPEGERTSTISSGIITQESDEKLKERVEKWKKFMLENPPPAPKIIEPEEKWDYYDKEYVKRKLGLIS